MKSASLATLLYLAAFTVARVPSLTRSFTSLSARNLSVPGCANFNGDDQHIKFYSGDSIFDMWVPKNGDNYDIGKPFARLGCNELSSSSPTRNSTCSECWDKMDHVEVMESGSCSFALTGDDSKLFSMQSDSTKGKTPFPAAGYLALVTCSKPLAKTARSTDDAELVCVEPRYSRVDLYTGTSDYTLSVPPNQTLFDVIGADSRIGCVGPLGQKYDMCQACNFPVDSLEVSIEALTCAFNFSGYADLVYRSSKDGPLLLPSPTQIWSVMCGLGDKHPERHDSLSERQPAPAPVACPLWKNKADVRIVENGTGVQFDLELRPDGSVFQVGRPPYSVGCLRRDKLYTDQCFPCTMTLESIEIPKTIYCFFVFIGPNDAFHKELWYGPKKGTLTASSVTKNLYSAQCRLMPTDGEKPAMGADTSHHISDPDVKSQKFEQRSLAGCLSTPNGVEFNTSDGIQAFMAVPADQQVYNLAGSDPELECYFYWERSTMPCHSCHNYEMATMLASAVLEECRFGVEGWGELLVWHADDRVVKHFDPPIKLLSVQCGFGPNYNPPTIQAKPHLAPREIVSQTLQSIDETQCHDSISDGYEVVWLWATTPTGRSKFQLNVYPHGQWYRLYGDVPDLGCARALANNAIVHASPFTCYRCEMNVDQIRFDSQRGGACRFKLDGLDEPVEIEANNDDIWAWNTTEPKRILEVSCQVESPQDVTDKEVAPPLMAVSSDDQTDIGSHLPSLARLVRDTAAPSTDDQCPISGFKVSIQTADGNVYFPPVPLDYEFHPMVDMQCARLSDAACIPCSQIGAAVSVNTAIQWGPCIFFTEDHRQFFTQYWNSGPDGSKETPPTSIYPRNAISGIECGSGA